MHISKYLAGKPGYICICSSSFSSIFVISSVRRTFTGLAMNTVAQTPTNVQHERRCEREHQRKVCVCMYMYMYMYMNMSRLIIA